MKNVSLALKIFFSVLKCYSGVLVRVHWEALTILLVQSNTASCLAKLLHIVSFRFVNMYSVCNNRFFIIKICNWWIKHFKSMRFLMIHGFIILAWFCLSFVVHSDDDKLICTYFKKLWRPISDVIIRRA